MMTDIETTESGEDKTLTANGDAMSTDKKADINVKKTAEEIEKDTKMAEEKNEDDSSEKEKEDVVDKESEEKAQDNDDDEEEDDEDDEEELPPGLLEKPLIIESGKREKKKVERLSMTTTEKKEVSMEGGSGDKLGDMARVEFQLTKHNADELKMLHRLLYGRPGSGNEIKRNIRKFCGFHFARNSSDYDKKQMMLQKQTMAALKCVCLVLDLEKGGTKEAVIGRILDFVMEPKNSGRQAPKGKKRKSKGSAPSKSKRARRATGKEKKSGKATRKSKSKEEVDDDEDDDDDEEEDEEEEEEEEEIANEEEKEENNDEEGSDLEEAEEEKVKSGKKDKSRASSKAKGKLPKEETEQLGSDDSDDDLPLAVSTTKKPTDHELVQVVETILEGANLEEVTMKKVCNQVYEKYPKFDLTDRKDFIKEAVRQALK